MRPVENLFKLRSLLRERKKNDTGKIVGQQTETNLKRQRKTDIRTFKTTEWYICDVGVERVLTEWKLDERVSGYGDTTE